jgi:hypothetical protein
MPPRPELPQLLDQLLAGCEDAARAIVLLYSEVIRRVIRRHLDQRVRPAQDSTDLTQAVWKSFFARPPAGAVLRDPEALEAYLRGMARHKAQLASRRQSAACRDRAREVPLGSPAVDPESDLVDPRPGPARRAESRDLWAQVLAGYDADQRAALEAMLNGSGLRGGAALLGGSVFAASRLFLEARERAVRLAGLTQPANRATG